MSSEHPSLSLTLLNELNNLGDAFEKAWRAGEQPRIEEYLDGRAESDRTTLFQILLEIEVEFRRESGERIDLGDYVTRFKPYTEVIRALFAPAATEPQTELKSPSTAEAPASSAAPNPQVTTAALVPGESTTAAGPALFAVPERRNLSSLSTSELLNPFDDAHRLQRLQVFDDHFQRYRSILGRNGIADLLRVSFSVGEIQDFVRILLAAAPQAGVVEELRLYGQPSLGELLFKVVAPKHRHWPREGRVPREFQESIA